MHAPDRDTDVKGVQGFIQKDQSGDLEVEGLSGWLEASGVGAGRKRRAATSVSEHRARDQGSAGRSRVFSSMCVTRSDVRLAVGRGPILMSHLGLEEDNGVGQETLLLISLWTYA